MSAAEWSLAALAAIILISCVTNWNVGVLAIALAWVVGAGPGGMSDSQVIAGFPSSLFLTLAGTMLLFGQVQANGTLERVAQRVTWLCRGNAGLFPIAFFFFGMLLSTAGPGNITAGVVLIPMSMAVAGRAGIPGLLMTVMVVNGVNAGSLSPFAPVGIVVRDIFERTGVEASEWSSWAVMAAVHVVVAAGAFLAFGGWGLLRRGSAKTADGSVTDDRAPFERRHWLTMGVVLAWIVAVAVFQAPIGLAAFAAAAIATALRLADHSETVRRMPWAVIVLISGMTMLISILDRTQGLELFTSWLARVSTPGTVTGVVAFVTGIVSAYSSTSGVVIPTFVPMAPGLAQQLGVQPLPVAWAMSIGGHLVDVSPVSTLGALALAAAPEGTDTRALFNRLMAYGLSMAPIGALVCWLLLGRS